MSELKIRRIGNSYGVILPRELLDHLQVKEEATVYASKTADGITLTTHDDTFAKAMEAFEEGRHKFRNALRELAK